MKKILYLLILLITTSVFAQIPAASFPDGIKAKSVELEELTTAQRDALVLVEGKQIYNTDTDQIQYYNGSAWVTPSGGGAETDPIYTAAVSGAGDRLLRNDGGSDLIATYAKLNQQQTFSEQQKFSQGLKLVSNGNFVEAGTISIGRAGTDIFSMKKEDNNSLLGIDYSGITQNRILVAPDKAGTIALLDDISGSGNVPTGGTTGQVLAKASNTDNDVEWVDQSGGGSIENYRVTGSGATAVIEIGDIDSFDSDNVLQIDVPNNSVHFQNADNILMDGSLDALAIKAEEIQLDTNGGSFTTTLNSQTLTGDNFITFPNTTGSVITTINGNPPDATGNIVVSSGSGGHTIQEDGTNQTARANLNFTENFDITDDSGNDRTSIALKDVVKQDVNSPLDIVVWGGTQAQHDSQFPSGAPTNYLSLLTDANSTINSLELNFLDFVTDATTKSKILANDDTQDASLVKGFFDDAFDYCKANDIKSLTLPSGTYVTDKVIIDDLDDFFFKGAGAIIKPNTGDAIFETTNCEKWTVTGFVFDSNAVAYADVSYWNISTNSSWFSFFDCTFKNMPRTGIRAQNLAGGTFTKGIDVMYCRFADSPNYSNVNQCGIELGIDAEYSKIVNNNFYNIPSAVRFVDGANSQFSHNICMLMNGDAYDSNYDNAIIYSEFADNSGKLDISFNKINHNDTGMAAIVVKGDATKPQNAVKIIGNDILVHGSVTKSLNIYLKDAPYSLITSNKIRGNTGTPNDTGIILEDSEGCTIDDLYVKSYDTGLSLINSANTKVGKVEYDVQTTDLQFDANSSSVKFQNLTTSQSITAATNITNNHHKQTLYNYTGASLAVTIPTTGLVDDLEFNLDAVSGNITVAEGSNTFLPSGDKTLNVGDYAKILKIGDTNQYRFLSFSNAGGIVTPSEEYDYNDVLEYYRFNNNVNSEIASNNGSGTDLTYTSGLIYNALDMNGTTSVVSIPDDDIFTLTGAFTINMLVNFDALGDTQLLWKRDGSNAEYICNYNSASDRILFNLYTDTSNYISVSKSTIGLSTNTWALLTITWDGTDENGLNLYLDNALVGDTKTETGTFTGSSNSTAPVTFGKNMIANNQFLDGQVNALIFWNVEHSLNEVISVYDKLINNSQHLNE